MVPGFPERELTDPEAKRIASSRGPGARPQCRYLSCLCPSDYRACKRLSLPPGKPLILAKMLTPHLDAAVSRPTLMAELTLFGFQPSQGSYKRDSDRAQPLLTVAALFRILSFPHRLLLGSLSISNPPLPTFPEGSWPWVRAYSESSRTLCGNSL